MKLTRPLTYCPLLAGLCLCLAACGPDPAMQQQLADSRVQLEALEKEAGDLRRSVSDLTGQLQSLVQAQAAQGGDTGSAKVVPTMIPDDELRKSIGALAADRQPEVKDILSDLGYEITGSIGPEVESFKPYRAHLLLGIRKGDGASSDVPVEFRADWDGEWDVPTGEALRRKIKEAIEASESGGAQMASAGRGGRSSGGSQGGGGRGSNANGTGGGKAGEQEVPRPNPGPFDPSQIRDLNKDFGN
ncbi:MAG: hypothetical protein R3F11_14895 [Verrucomicrobiales bacterium]